MKPIVFTWLPDAPGGIFKISVSAPTLTAGEIADVEAIGRAWGFIPKGSVWETPESSEAIQGFNGAARRAGFDPIWP
ncbi:hypothetical protein ELG97_37010 [Rhizobium leguminosarum]|uniref:hypothetical protein n=1 Tax=Rhizobium leguminosarum TaxID=384 RepID=UPI0010303C82|nr:hypothetical protein [Rhizobium leguminosarum]TBE73833.1 hypothetical protein ELG97_37010 [Rhizobium leguminosarum]